MAEQDRSQRTEQASEKRLREARERGQVARSRELSMAAVVLATTAYVVLARGDLGRDLAALLADGLSLDRRELLNVAELPRAFGAGVLHGLQIFAPVAFVSAVAAVAASLAFGGWTFSLEALQPKFERLNPLAGLRRIFGWNGLAELAKAMAKFLLVAVVGGFLLWGFADELLNLSRLGMERGLGESARVAGLCALGLAAILVLIAAADVPFQWWQHHDRLKMTKQEVRDELRDSEGKPELRSRIRSMQQEIATRRMMAEVPKADVVAVNPTHFAVALRYEGTKMRAPRVVAKGADLIAFNIRAVAEANGVPIFEHPPLTRALYYNTKLGAEIPQRLYLAVAQVLTYVYQLRRGQLGRPVPQPHIDVDPDLFERRGPQKEVDA